MAVVHDRENLVVEMNHTAERFTGYPARELRGRPFWRDVIAPDDAARYRGQFAHVPADVLPEGYETWWTLRDGRRRLMVWTHRPLLVAGRELRLTTAFDVTDRRDREDRLQYLAYHDDLTGLANRRRFMEELDHRLATARRYAEPLGVLMLDVDGLKSINDRLGHAAGDDVLHEVATRIRARLRTSDVAARLGGDEFAVLLSRADRTRADNVRADIVAVTTRPVLLGRGPLRVTVSAGAAAFPADASTAAGLLRIADERLYIGRSRRRAEEVPPVPDEDRVRAVLDRQARRAGMRRSVTIRTSSPTMASEPDQEPTR